MPKLPTIKLSGKDYAQVKDRVMAFNNEFKNGSIQTKPTFAGEIVYIEANIYPDVANKERVFTAHSYGTLKGVKAFEKLESVAVGRALAYLGFGIDGSIASFEEMEEFEKNNTQANHQVVEIKPVEKINLEQIKLLHTLFNEYSKKAGKDMQKFKDEFKQANKVNSTKDLTATQAKQAIEMLQNKIKELQKDLEETTPKKSDSELFQDTKPITALADL